ncbi:universal stress protein [Janibacter melonis]|uniref:universal stress protein n=1 Tax=Janibacter melonis TaxID=262209 RepID=UPI001E36CC7A|nr:universal stress protein [Janibacter melonis]MCB5991964.1 universal stress protein [Janibacter melonis]
MKVVVGYRATEAGRAALAEAVSHGRAHGSELVLVVPAAERAEADDALAAAGAEAEVVEVGDDRQAETELLDRSYEDDTQMLVIGLRRRSPVGKLFLGSTAQRLLLEAGCPVVAVKPEVAPRR